MSKDTGPIPPAVGEFAIQERAKLLAHSAAIQQEANTWEDRAIREATACVDLRARLAKYEDAEGRPVVVPDEVFEKEFLAWWESDGQFCRAGGGNYERTFAFEAWRHLYPMLMQARATLSAPNHGEQVQWWLAELDQYGNPTLIDGMHPDLAGANRAFYIYRAFSFTKGEHYAVAKVELFEPVADKAGVNHEAVETVQSAMLAASPSAGSQGGAE